MFEFRPVRVSARALFRSAAIGSVVGLGLGTAYVAVAAVGDLGHRLRAHRLADAAARGFSEAALREQGEGMAPGALSIAKRHDPYTVAGDDARDRDAALLAARLERTVAGRGERLRRVESPAAKPVRMGGALDGARELDCLTQAVYFEARGEGAAGQAAVAQVVLNRVKHPAFPKSVCGVVYQGASAQACQFSFACDGLPERAREGAAWRRARTVAARALDGQVAAEVGGATHFHAARVSPRWSGFVKVAAVGQHVFYRQGGRKTAPGAYRQRPKPEAEAKTVYASMLPTQISAPQFMSLTPVKPAAPKAEVQKADQAAEAPRAVEAAPAPKPAAASAPAT